MTTPASHQGSPSKVTRHAVDRCSNDVTGCFDAKERATRKIQRLYRGYRTRRELRGLSLAASTRRFMPTSSQPGSGSQWSRSGILEEAPQEHDDETISPARRNWQRAVSVAIQAGADDDRAAERVTTTKGSSHHSDVIRQTPPKVMDLQYFLEMVDRKHRHGSNLRAYHNVWKNSPSSENFFYWLDQGDGRSVDLPRCPRERLEKEQVRYLSPKERFDYLVKVDQAGLFRWAKNDELVDTDDRRYRDSVHGVVHVNDDAPRFQGYSEEGTIEREEESAPPSSQHSSQIGRDNDGESSVPEDGESEDEAERPIHATPGAMHDLFAASLSIKKGTWLFVADSSYRIYVGIKEPGAFQHSSFLRGGRISAAGMLRIRHGQLRSLAPLSGHYRPHVANFRAFHHSLQDRGVDLSHVWISKSYAVLAGIEGYVSAKHKMHALHETRDTAKKKMHMIPPHDAKLETSK